MDTRYRCLFAILLTVFGVQCADVLCVIFVSRAVNFIRRRWPYCSLFLVECDPSIDTLSGFLLYRQEWLMSWIANQNGDGIQNGREEGRLLWDGSEQ